MPFKGGQRPLLQSQPGTNNCETPQTRAQESFGLILTSPEDVERNDAKREKGASIWRLPGPTSPKNREQREPHHIAVTSSFPALKMPKSPRIRVPGAFGAESVCYGYIGGGAGNRTRVQKAGSSAVYERSLRFYLTGRLPRKQDYRLASPPKWSLSVSGRPPTGNSANLRPDPPPPK